jgi:hypothetical protein
LWQPRFYSNLGATLLTAIAQTWSIHFLGRIGMAPTLYEDPSSDRYRFTMLRGARKSAGIWRMTCTAASDNE